VAICEVLHFAQDIEAVRQFPTIHYNPIFILITYRYYQGKTRWNRNQKTARFFLLISLLCKDCFRLTKPLIEGLLDYVSGDNVELSLKKIQGIFKENKRSFEFNINAFLDKNISMFSTTARSTLQLIYANQIGFKPDRMTDKDHIFPDSALKHYQDENGEFPYDKNERDSILNCELLDEDFNRNIKRDALPQDFFTNTYYFEGNRRKLDNFIKLHAIPKPQECTKDVWNIKYYRDFLEERKKRLKQRLEDIFKGFITPDEKGVLPNVKKFRDKLNSNDENN